jgi:FkbM family methyltransferase
LNLIEEEGTIADFIGIFLEDMYMIENLKNIHSVIDIGANQGLFALYARSLYPEAKIHAYEPNPVLSPRLRAHCAAIEADVFVEAVGSSDGRCSLEIIGDSNLTRAHSAEAGEAILTSIARVIDRVGAEVDLLKLDCEGFEWKIFEDGATLRRARYLAMEYHCWANGSSHDDVGPLLNELGFILLRQERLTDFGQALARRRDLRGK